MSQQPTDTEKDRAPKKAYVKPELKEFGDVAELTRTLNPDGANDGGMSLMTKT
jgi:hypothetical protein